MAREGALVDRACFPRAGGLDVQMPDQIDPDGELMQCAAGATSVARTRSDRGWSRAIVPIMTTARPSHARPEPLLGSAGEHRRDNSEVRNVGDECLARLTRQRGSHRVGVGKRELCHEVVRGR